ncbi:hypothetical protein AMK15_17740 [Streptomyces sp. MJM1172]|nr:hypothetical protein AMK15_17740 [Streptomyces sp. MJM1172]
MDLRWVSGRLVVAGPDTGPHPAGEVPGAAAVGLRERRPHRLSLDASGYGPGCWAGCCGSSGPSRRPGGAGARPPSAGRAHDGSKERTTSSVSQPIRRPPGSEASTCGSESAPAGTSMPRRR